MFFQLFVAKSPGQRRPSPTPASRAGKPCTSAGAALGNSSSLRKMLGEVLATQFSALSFHFFDFCWDISGFGWFFWLDLEKKR